MFRVWFEYKNKLDCIKAQASDELDYVADLKQAIHSKLGSALSSTALDLELFLPNPSAIDPLTGVPYLRPLRADMHLSNVYGVSLLQHQQAGATSPAHHHDASLSSTRSSPPHVVVISVPLVRNNNPNNNSPIAAQTTRYQHHGVVTDLPAVAAQEEDDGFIATDEGAGGDQDEHFAFAHSNGRARNRSNENNNNNAAYSLHQQQQQQPPLQPNGIVTIGLDVVTSKDTKTIVGCITLELPISEVLRATNEPASSNKNSNSNKLFCNRYVLDRVRDAISKNIATAMARAIAPKLLRTMIYDTEFSEYVLFSEATNSASFPIWTTLDSRSGKLIGRPSLLAVIDFVDGVADGAREAGFVVTSPLYIAIPTRPASAASTAASTAAGSIYQDTASSRPGTSMHRYPAPPTQPLPTLASVSAAQAATSAPYFSSGPGGTAAAAALPPSTATSSRQKPHQRPHSAHVTHQQQQSANPPLGSPAATQNQNRNNNNSPSHLYRTASLMSSSAHRPWSASAAATSASSALYRRNPSGNNIIPVAASAFVVDSRRLSPPRNVNATTPIYDQVVKEQQQHGSSTLSFPASASESNNRNNNNNADEVQKSRSVLEQYKKDLGLQREQIDGLVARLTKLASELRDEQARTRQLELLLGERQLTHEEQLIQVRKDAERQFHQEHEARMSELNAQLDGQIQELRNEVFSLRQNKKNNSMLTISGEEASELRRSIALLEAENESLNKKRNALETHMETAAAKLDKLKKDRDQLQDQVNVSNAERNSLAQELSNAMESVGALREMTRLQLKVEELEQSLSLVQHERNATHKEMAKLRDDLVLVERRAEEAEATLDTFRSQWGKENGEKMRRIADLTRVVASGQTSRGRDADAAIEATKMLDDTKKEVDAVRLRLLAMTLERDAERKRVEELCEEKMALQIEGGFRSKAMDLTRQNIALMQERDRLKQQLWEAEHDLSEQKTANQTAAARRMTEAHQGQSESASMRVLLEENATMQAKLSQSIDTETILRGNVDNLQSELAIYREKMKDFDPSLARRVSELMTENDALRKQLLDKEVALSSAKNSSSSSSSTANQEQQRRQAEEAAQRERGRERKEAEEKMALQLNAVEASHAAEIERINKEWQQRLAELNNNSSSTNSTVHLLSAPASPKTTSSSAAPPPRRSVSFASRVEERPESSAVAVPDADTAADSSKTAQHNKQANVLLSFQRAIRRSSVADLKQVQLEKQEAVRAREEERVAYRSDLQAQQRDTLGKDETVARYKVIEEELRGLNLLQKKFEDEVLQHMADLGSDLSYADTFHLDDEDEVDELLFDEDTGSKEDSSGPLVLAAASSAQKQPPEDLEHPGSFTWGQFEDSRRPPSSSMSGPSSPNAPSPNTKVTTATRTTTGGAHAAASPTGILKRNNFSFSLADSDNSLNDNHRAAAAAITTSSTTTSRAALVSAYSARPSASSTTAAAAASSSKTGVTSSASAANITTQVTQQPYHTSSELLLSPNSNAAFGESGLKRRPSVLVKTPSEELAEQQQQQQQKTAVQQPVGGRTLDLTDDGDVSQLRGQQHQTSARRKALDLTDDGDEVSDDGSFFESSAALAESAEAAAKSVSAKASSVVVVAAPSPAPVPPAAVVVEAAAAVPTPPRDEAADANYLLADDVSSDFSFDDPNFK